MSREHDSLFYCLLRRSLPTGRHQDDPVRAGLMDQQVAVPRWPHVPQDAAINASRGDCPALESLCLGIESYKRIRPLCRLVVPNDIVHYGDGIRMRLRPAGRRPFLDLARFRIQPAKPAETRIDVPDHTVTRDIESPYRGLRIGQGVLPDFHRLR